MADFSLKKDADDFCLAIQNLYEKSTAGGASITGVVVPYEEAEGEPGFQTFEKVVKTAATELRKAKSRPKAPVTLTTQSFWKRCERCGQFPVVTEIRLTASQSLQVCRICEQKRQVAETLKDTKSSPSSPLARLAAACGNDWPGDPAIPEEIEQLGRYIGFIYADGNGVGSVLENKLKTKADQKVFSQILEASVIQTLVEVIKDWTKDPGRQQDQFLLLPIITGGDDIIVITNAAYALDIARRICLTFQSQVTEQTRLKKVENEMGFEGESIPLSMSAGVVIAKSSHPIYELQRLAYELLQSAKLLNHQLKNKYGEQGTVEFRVITSPTANSWKQVREYEFYLPDISSSTQNWATCRPYPCAQIPGLDRPSLDDLLAAANKLQGFPRNKIHAWQELLRVQPALQAELDLSVLRSHLNKAQRDDLQEVSRSMRLPTNTALYLTDPFDTHRLISPLPDLEEVFDFAGVIANDKY